jgi:hypothetical protein
MPRQLLLKRARGPRGTLLFDVATGRTAPAGDVAGARAQGTQATVAEQSFALYAEQGELWFQWNERRWPLAAPDLQLSYAHDLAAAATTFTAGDRSITYPAWWRGDPAFDPLVPEQDEQEDYLAYVVAVWSDPLLQASLLDAWA